MNTEDLVKTYLMKKMLVNIACDKKHPLYMDIAKNMTVEQLNQLYMDIRELENHGVHLIVQRIHEKINPN